MTVRARSLLAAGALLAAACTSPESTGVVDVDEVLLRADDTPGKQGYLYVAMAESMVAAQYAGLARGAGDDLGAVRSALGEVVYALDPERAPDWGAKSAGLVSGWAGLGFGALRASERAAELLEEASTSSSASAALRDVGPDAIRCISNTRERADRLLTLSAQALRAPTTAQLTELLPTIDSLANELNDGAAGPSSGTTCGLSQAARDLKTVAATQRAS